MSAPKKSPIRKKRANRVPLLIIVAGVILAAGGLAFALRRPAPESTHFSPVVKGAPSIMADKVKVDLGNMKLGSTANVSFTITNTGDQPLRFTKQPFIEVKEGC